LRDRLRQLLQPPVVREAAVPHGRVGSEDDLELLGRLRFGSPIGARSQSADRVEGGVRDHSIVKSAPPALLEVRFATVTLPDMVVNDLVAREAGLVRQSSDDLVSGLSRVERSDQWLDDSFRPI